ncbi:MAG TPA: hypothetical protein VHO68_03705 [Bacteroidales bacterium]|jgi:hypothetical protein|nr:hypothetical protein [Bacteroidales bacterium]
MYRYIFRFFVITLTILIANLLTTVISDYLITYRNHMRPATFTFIAMGIIVVIFYPLFTMLEEWVKKISVKFIKSGKGVAGKYLGILFTFVAAMLVLFYFYGKMWYHIDFLKVVLHGDIAKYF